jgi:hypothetical protein
MTELTKSPRLCILLDPTRQGRAMTHATEPRLLALTREVAL